MRTDDRLATDPAADDYRCMRYLISHNELGYERYLQVTIM
jgi:hypothetical protein